MADALPTHAPVQFMAYGLTDGLPMAIARRVDETVGTDLLVRTRTECVTAGMVARLAAIAAHLRHYGQPDLDTCARGLDQLAAFFSSDTTRLVSARPAYAIASALEGAIDEALSGYAPCLRADDETPGTLTARYRCPHCGGVGLRPAGRRGR